MEKVEFINEIGNHIEIKIKSKDGFVVNSETKKNIKSVLIQIIGPTSMSENEITYEEAVQLQEILFTFLVNYRYEFI